MEELFEKTENKQEEGNHKEQKPTKLKTERCFFENAVKSGNSLRRQTLLMTGRHFSNPQTMGTVACAYSPPYSMYRDKEQVNQS